MTNAVIKNLNNNLHRRLRFIGVNGATIDIGAQTGAVLLYGSDLRICLSPFTELSCEGSTPTTSVVEMLGTFDLDINGTIHTDLTIQQLYDLMQTPDVTVEAVIDPTPYNLNVEYT